MKLIRQFVLLAVFITGCSDNKSENQVSKETAANNSYEIISESKSETIGKAQLVEYALYKDTIYNHQALKEAMMQIYNNNQEKDAFDSHEKATVIAVYLFTSNEAFKDKANWIAMLIKAPSDIEPRISYNDFKINALSNTQDKVKSKDEIELEKLKTYLSARGLDLCTLSDTLKKMELDNIHKADATYPDYGDKHMAMIDRLDRESYRNLRMKYKMSDDMLNKVSIFAMSYCK